jgi:hypothetical protein
MSRSAAARSSTTSPRDATFYAFEIDRAVSEI